MKTYKCEYTQFVNDRHLDEEIDAESHREAYEKFLENHGTHNAPVYVTSGIFGSAAVFREHIKKAPDKTAMMEAADAKRQEMHAAATEDAQASLSSTDMLLKQLIAEQKETNQWLRKIRWSLLIISIIVALWYGFGWIIYPIR